MNHPSNTAAPDALSFRWAIFAAMCAVYFTFGVILLAIPPMIDEVRADLGVSRGVLGFALGAWATLYIVTAPPSGRLIDRLGLRRSLTAGSLLVSVSAALQSVAPGIATLWLAIAIIGVGGPLVSLSAPKLVAVWFTSPRERSLAVGFYTSAPALGGVLALFLTNPVLLPLFGGWRGVLMFEAALNLMAVCIWIVVSGRARNHRSPASEPEVAPLAGSAAARNLLHSATVRLAMVLGVGTFFVTQGLSAWLPNMLAAQAGISAGAASSWAAVSMSVGIVARLLMPGLTRPDRRSMMLQLSMLALAVAMLLLAFGPPATGVAATLVLGLRSAPTSLVILVLMDADRVTTANVGLAYGLWFSAVQVGGALGPPVVGVFGDSQLGFEGALVAMTAVLAAMIVVLRRDDWRRRHPIAPNLAHPHGTVPIDDGSLTSASGPRLATRSTPTVDPCTVDQSSKEH